MSAYLQTDIDFLGDTDQQILVSYHPPMNRLRSTAILIAPPIGSEYLRTHWALRRLANQFARAGFPVMRVDYRGQGDSAMNVEDIHALQVWHDDLALASERLKAQSQCEQVVIFGLRFGATLAMQAASQLAGLSHLVCLDPVLKGADYLHQLRRMHSQMIDLWPRPISTINDSNREEILGSVYSKKLLQEIAQWDYAKYFDRLAEIDIDIFSSDPSVQIYDGVPRVKVTQISDAADWGDLRRLEIAWLPHESLRAVAKFMVDDCTGSRS